MNFKNTIIIMTSNLGSTHLLEGIDSDGHISDAAREDVLSLLRSQFRPEFLNRVDETVLFKPLSLNEIAGIVGLLLADLRKRLALQSIGLSLDEAAEEYIAKEGYDPVYGARPLKRFIQQHLETPLSRKIIAGELAEGATATVTVSDGLLNLSAN